MFYQCQAIYVNLHLVSSIYLNNEVIALIFFLKMVCSTENGAAIRGISRIFAQTKGARPRWMVLGQFLPPKVMFSQAPVILFTGGEGGSRNPLPGRHPPLPGWLLQRIVRILLECILVSPIFSKKSWLTFMENFKKFIRKGNYFPALRTSMHYYKSMLCVKSSFRHWLSSGMFVRHISSNN